MRSRTTVFALLCATLAIVPTSRAVAGATDLFAADHTFEPPVGVEKPSNVGIPPARDGNQARLLINGEAAFQARLDLLDQAQRSIHVQVLIFKADDIGSLIGRELIRRKRENPKLDIRVIVDAYANVQVRLIRNRPREGETYVEQAYVTLIEGATRSVLIENAYFVPTPAVQAALLAAAGRGVEVTVIANSKETNDIPIITDAGRLSYRELIEAGAHVHEWHAERHAEGTVHSKFAVFDERIALIGSYNLDPRSRGLNSEDVVLIDHAPLAGELADHFRTVDLPWSDEISLEQAQAWDDPSLLPDVRERPKVLTDPAYQRDLFEYYLIRQIQGSL